MVFFYVVLCIISIQVAEAQFDPDVTINCLNGDASVDVVIASGASTSGKVALYVGTTLCDEQNTPSTAITISFTTASCAGYPAVDTQFYIYVTEGATVQAGLPDEVYQVSCSATNVKSVNQLILSTVGSVTDFVTPAVDLRITDASDVVVSWLTVGTSYKLKLTCQDPFVNDFDIIALKIIANDVVTLVENGCSNYPTFFDTPTHPGQCQLVSPFTGFQVTATNQPQVLYFDTVVQMCGGACATPGNCVTEPAWGRKRREANGTKTVHLYKEITVYPSNETAPDSGKATDAQKQVCISLPVVYFVCAMLIILSALGVALAFFLFVTWRRLKSRGMHDWTSRSKLNSQRGSSSSRKF